MSRDVTFVMKAQAQPPSFFFLSLLPSCHLDVYQSSTLSISGEFTGTEPMILSNHFSGISSCFLPCRGASSAPSFCKIRAWGLPPTLPRSPFNVIKVLPALFGYF
jgi:hypothetical protein